MLRASVGKLMVAQTHGSAHLHIGLEILDGGLSRAQPALSLVVLFLHIVLPLPLVGRQLQLPLLAVTRSPLGF